MKHRIFIAINLSEKAKTEVLNVQERMKKLELPVRWITREALHITLAFLGYLEDEQLEEVKKVVEEATKVISPFRLSTGELDFFPNIKRARVVMIHIEGDTVVFQMNKNLREGLAKLPYIRLEKRAFKPHLTLARVKKEGWGRKSGVLEKLKEIKIHANWEVKSIDVMESKLSPKGAEYKVVKSCELK